MLRFLHRMYEQVNLAKTNLILHIEDRHPDALCNQIVI